MCFYPLGADDLTGLDEFEGMSNQVNFGFWNSQAVAVETLCFHQAVHFLDHEWVVQRSDQLNMSMMARTVIARQTTSLATGYWVERRNSHSSVVQAAHVWIVEVVESLCVGD